MDFYVLNPMIFNFLFNLNLKVGNHLFTYLYLIVHPAQMSCIWLNMPSSSDNFS